MAPTLPTSRNTFCSSPARVALIGAPYITVEITTAQGPFLVHKVPRKMIRAFTTTVEARITEGGILPFDAANVQPAALLAVLSWMKATVLKKTRTPLRFARFPIHGKPFADVVAVYKTLEHLGITSASEHLLKHLTWVINNMNIKYEDMVPICKLFQPKDKIVQVLAHAMESRQRSGRILKGAQFFIDRHDGFRAIVEEVADKRRKAEKRKKVLEERAARKAAQKQARANAAKGAAA